MDNLEQNKVTHTFKDKKNFHKRKFSNSPINKENSTESGSKNFSRQDSSTKKYSATSDFTSTPNHHRKQKTNYKNKSRNEDKKYYSNRFKSSPQDEKPPHKRQEISTEAPVVFAHCKICSAGISNETYAIKTGDDNFIHFECALKKVKEIGQKNFSHTSKLKYSYIGSNTFVVYLEQGGNQYSWKILQKIKLEEILPPVEKKTTEIK